MNINRRNILLAGGTAMAAYTLGELGKPRRAAAQNEVVNVYSSRHYKTDDDLYDNFTRITGIEVNLIEGKANPLIERIKSEGANSPADVLITVDAGRLWKADQAGIFAPVNSSELNSKIPANLRHPDNHWFGFTKRARVIMYNKDRVNPADLSTYENLADPKWQGRIAIRSSSNVYNQSLVASLIASLGVPAVKSWVESFVGNFARKPQGNDRAQIEAVAAGIADIAIANTYYLPRYIKSDDPAKQAIFKKVGVFFPNQQNRGAHINISGGGLVKTAPNPGNAIKFLEYLTSPTAQTFFAQANSEYPVVPGTPIDPVLAGFGFPFKEDPTSVSKYGPNSATAVQLMDIAGWV
ncbi:Fe(3+) ABC transporter substrate-binding protein [Moorena sp. SIO4G3]|uniref:Fe(3+) ABC transporter substrate-binding protein n=1 Tax=Moorena sp. SIO4G3 TaxID=2607821 RepID=UPI00142CCD9E|nr:Fe(3+) ABC transporter substrate-binding protein [Moorena sp. SIO4G3]NEO77867.1 Fe(3+) ABC transporter substrate-binding protein [Moorena sp. SIO4G3]